LITASTAGAQTDTSSASTPEPSAADTTTPAAAPARSKGVLPIPDYKGDLSKRQQLTGDWNGSRTDLADKGLQFQFDWVQIGQGVVSGGRDTGLGYTGNLDYVMFLDFDRMGLVPGGMLKIRGETRYGEAVNGKSGQILPVNTPALFPLTNKPDETVPFTLTDVVYFQYLSEKFGLFAGKMDTLDGDPNEFASGRGDTQFLNSNLVFNSVSALSVPYSTLGAGFVWNPSKQILLTGSVINTADSSTTTGFDHVEDGWTGSLEADFQYKLGDLPGGMNVGGIYAWAREFNDFGRLVFVPGEGLSATTKDSTWAIYWSGWQYLFVEDKSDAPINIANGLPDRQGLGLFARAGVADDETNPVEWTVNGGFGGRGLIPSRDNDMFGVGYFYMSLQSQRFLATAGIQDHSQGFEAFYNIALTPAALLTFDVQVVEPPNTRLDTGVVLAARLHLKF
jgi:porin